MITVLLPTYNSATTISGSVKSILNQTFHNFELLILDDGSTDNTENIVSRVDDRRVHYYKLFHQGLAKTLNYGLSIAKYDIIARMDADDICINWRFEKQLSILKQLQRKTILSSWYGIFTGSTLNYCVTPPITSNEIKKGLLLHSYISHPALMFYKEILIKEGGYSSSDNEQAFEDYETWLKIKDRVEFYIIPEILVFQRFRKESLSNNIAYKQRILYSIQKPYYADLQHHFGIIDRCEENLYRGWREYFFGNKRKARAYWIKLGHTILEHPRVVLAWFVTLLPENIFIQFKEYRLKFRLWYLVNYWTKSNVQVRKQFASLIQ